MLSNFSIDEAGTWQFTAAEFDGMGRTTTVEKPDNTYLFTDYSVCGCAGGLLTNQYDERNNRKTTESDFRGRLQYAREYEPQLTFDYDLQQWVITDYLLHAEVEYQYDALDRITNIIHRSGWGQASAGKLTSPGQTRTFTYDQWGRAQNETTPEAGTTSYTYNSNDQLATTTNANNKITTVSYNTRNLVTGITNNDGTPSVSYGYDDYGARSTMTDGEGTMSYSYNSFRQLQSETRTFTGLGSNQYTFNYSYNLGRQLTQANYVAPSFNKNVNYAYNAKGALNGIGTNLTGSDPNTTTNVISAMSYKAFGAASSISYGNNRQATLSYDNTLMRLTAMEVARPNGSDRVLAYNYAYLENGLLWQVQDALDSTYLRAFEYNYRNQLTKTTGNWSQTVNTYSYDDWGNLTNRDGGTLSYATGSGSVPTTNRLTSTTYGGTTNFSYDSAGNMTAANSTSYQWDAANRLKSVNNGSLGSYGYDGNGKRVKKSESGTTTYYVISSVLGSVIEVTSAGVQRAYVMSGGAVVAQLNPNGQFYWLHLDHLGSGRKMTDSSGNMVYRAEFDPYGKLLYEWSSPTNLNTRKFTGYERDAATNLDYAQARMYSSDWGRFMSPDPIGLKSANLNVPQSLNRYSYVNNNPVNAVDPTGLLTLLVHGTGSDPNEHEWARINSDFWQAVRDTFGEDPTPFDWREFSSTPQVSILTFYSGIYGGAAKLVNFLNNVYPFQEGEKLNIVAHSHGGNIVKLASYFLNRKIDNLITLGTPQNDDLVKINRSAVRNYCNVSSMADYKQFYGSSPNQVYNFGYYTYWGTYHAYWGAIYLAAGIEAQFTIVQNPIAIVASPAYYFHRAGQHFQAAGIAFGLAAIWLLSTKMDPLANRNFLLGSESHHDLITAPTWNSRVKSGCGF